MQHTMKRRCGSDALVLSVVLVVSVMGASFAGDAHHERAEEEEETIGDQSSSGEGGDIAVARSEVNFGQPAEEHSLEEETASPSKAAAAAAAATREDDGGQEMTTTTGQSSSSSSDAAEAGGEAVAASPSAKVIIWEESVDLATVDPNQDEQAAAAAAGGGSRERKEPRPSQERHSDVEASKKKEGEAEAGEESQIVSEGRLHVNSASSLSSSSSIWNTALFAVFGSAVILFLMKNDVDSTSKQIYIRYSNTQCKRSEELSGREQLTCQFTHHSSAPTGIATSMAIQNS